MNIKTLQRYLDGTKNHLKKSQKNCCQIFYLNRIGHFINHHQCQFNGFVVTDMADPADEDQLSVSGLQLET